MTESAAERRQPLEPDQYVEDALLDPSNAGAGTRFVGLLGRSNRADHWRLYLSAALDDYLEIADSDVISAYKLDSTISPIGGTVLSVRPEARVVHMRVDTTNARNAFLKGQITGTFMAGSRPEMPLMPRAAAHIGGGGLGEHTGGKLDCIISHLFSCVTHDPESPVCAGHTETPGTADSCGMCTTRYNCNFNFPF